MRCLEAVVRAKNEYCEIWIYIISTAVGSVNKYYKEL